MKNQITEIIEFNEPKSLIQREHSISPEIIETDELISEIENQIQTIDIDSILEYEVASSRLATLAQTKRIAKMLANYFRLKTQRKYQRYKTFLVTQEITNLMKRQ